MRPVPAAAPVAASEEPAELTGLAGWAADVMERLGELGVAVLVLLENLFPPVPSELVLPLAGYLASRDRLDLVLVLVAATVGSVLGAIVLYEIGARTGRARVRRLVDRVPLVDVEDLDKAEAWFARHGETSVLFGRCLPVVRSLISLPAGMAGMPRWRFTVLTAVGSGTWNAAFVLAGYALGARFEQVGEYSGHLNTAVYVAIAVTIVLLVVRVVRRRSTG